MNATMLLLELALGIGFAFFVPVFFTAVAGMNASLGFPEIQGFLPKIFKIGFWFFLVASGVGLAALPFAKEERAESAVAAITGLMLAWRFWRAAKKENSFRFEVRQK
jgi:hypothetical protein